MIYLVSGQQQLFKSDIYTTISLEESLELIKNWKIYQWIAQGSEAAGRAVEFPYRAYAASMCIYRCY